MKDVDVYTDGSALSNSPDACAGWAVYFPLYKHLKSGCSHATNNHMELFAISHAIWKSNYVFKFINIKLRIFTDSEYSIKVLTGQNKAVKNKDLIDRTLALMKEFQKKSNVIEFIHVDAHTGGKDEQSVNNDIVDKQARMEARMLAERESNQGRDLSVINFKDIAHEEHKQYTYSFNSNFVACNFTGNEAFVMKTQMFFSHRLTTVSYTFRNKITNITLVKIKTRLSKRPRRYPKIAKKKKSSSKRNLVEDLQSLHKTNEASVTSTNTEETNVPNANGKESSVPSVDNETNTSNTTEESELDYDKLEDKLTELKNDNGEPFYVFKYKDYTEIYNLLEQGIDKTREIELNGKQTIITINPEDLDFEKEDIKPADSETSEKKQLSQDIMLNLFNKCQDFGINVKLVDTEHLKYCDNLSSDNTQIICLESTFRKLGSSISNMSNVNVITNRELCLDKDFSNVKIFQIQQSDVDTDEEVYGKGNNYFNKVCYSSDESLTSYLFYKLIECSQYENNDMFELVAEKNPVIKHKLHQSAVSNNLEFNLSDVYVEKLNEKEMSVLYNKHSLTVDLYDK